ncbi:NRDE family protein [Microbacterium sp. cx-55]|uniref:NRDE family protein n=1 Tax=Microbacterium sp. cx-55 TaxID=2875948 RepID=UPI001CBAB1AA|nr:NRDE family protein [Microbacterium sp. cx-55]MBZ4487559.1 NRDE family protein [Microbacterium sp. cx-55]UGB35579.1 NRDE family protein [Microbacterium sp. cx-55]
MCTVIVRVPENPDAPTRLIAIRDEDPGRPWNPVGPWWPDAFPGVLGVHDVRAGGAWLAADPGAGRLAVLLNRHDDGSLPDADAVSRGILPLASVAGSPPGEAPRTRGFNLLEIDGAASRVVSWDGVRRGVTELAPGTHMIAHDDLDDPRTARITRWLPEFTAADTDAAGAWWAPWLGVIERSTALAATDDRAIIRDHRHLGIPTLSLLICVASVRSHGVELRDATLPAPGTWGPLTF